MLEKIILKPYEWDVDDSGSHVMIRSFGFNQKSENCLLRIEEYQTFFYLELPLRDKNGYPHGWTKMKVQSIYDEISKFCDVDKKPDNFQLFNLRKLYYYDNFTRYPMMKLSFRTQKAADACIRFFKKPFRTSRYGYLQLTPHENKISIIRKFLTSRDITFCDWYEATGERVPDDEKISNCKHEYIIKWDSVNQIPFEQSVGWKVYPKFMAYDIECYSHNMKAMPKKEIDSNVSWMISCVVYRLGDDESKIKRYAILLGDCNDIPESRIQNCHIIRIKNADEVEMIHEFGRLIEKEDIDIITGYNIQTFDYPYLAHRLARCSEKWYPCGRIESEPTEYSQFAWESNGYGYNLVGMLKMAGRISIDLLPVIKRDYKLDKYSLDFVAKNFGVGKKNDVSPQEMFRIYETLVNVNSEFRRMYMDIFNLDPSDNQDYSTFVQSYADLIEEYKGDGSLYDYDDAYIKLREKYEIVKENVTKVLEYCVIDSELVIKIIRKINLWENVCGLSDVLGVSIVDLSTRGQQARCLSQLYHICSKQKPKIVVSMREHIPMKFAGGFVGEPIPGVYENVLCFDFASLYPSIIQAYNICYTTLVHPDDKTTKDEDCYVVEFDQEEPIDGDFKQLDDVPDYFDETDKYELFLDGEKKKKKTKTVHHRFRFYKHKEGILPALVRKLVSERRNTQAIQKESKDSFTKLILEKKQLGLKISANSFFGFLGVSVGGKAPLMEGAMSITALGRELIGKVNTFLSETHNAKVVYNDTDSSMVDIGIKDSKDCQYWGIKIAQELSGVKVGDEDPDFPGEKHKVAKTGIFHHPVLKLEFEKAMRLFCIRKKKYFAFLINKDGTFKMKKDAEGNNTEEYDPMKKGIVLARRDNFGYLREIYYDVILSIMIKSGFKETTTILINGIQKMYNKEIDYRKLAATKSLGASYKSDSAAMKVFADELKAEGKFATPGDRLEFLIIKKENEPLVGKKMKLIEQYEESIASGEPFELDYDYYVSHGLQNCLTQIYQIAFQNEIAKMNLVHYKPINAIKSIYLSDIVKILIKANEEGQSFDNIKQGIFNCYDHYWCNSIEEFDENQVKLHQINNPSRVELDLIEEQKQIEKIKKKTEPKKAIIKKTIIQKGQTKIDRFFPVVHA